MDTNITTPLELHHSPQSGIAVNTDEFIIRCDDPILVTGATGFIGSVLVEHLLNRGFRNILCLARTSRTIERITTAAHRHEGAHVAIIQGNLLSKDDCNIAVKDAKLIFHLAAARGEKSFPDAFMNSVVTTRNLLEAASRQHSVRRFVTISSFSVYSNTEKPDPRLLDESCPIDPHPELRGDSYCFAKVKQDELVLEYGKQLGIPFVIVRPGYVYGPGNEAITGRVGTSTFGLFLHLGGSNPLPLTYVDNCAAAIALAGLTRGVDGELFNVVDDDLPTSRQFLRLYKRNVTRFPSLYVPHAVSYILCYLWETYSTWSQGQLPPVFNRRIWHASWKKTRYSNQRLKSRLGWMQPIPTSEALQRYFAACRNRGLHA